MSDIYLGIVLVCACAGIISECITIAIPEKILSITEHDPEKLLHKRFYKFVFTLSGLYVLVIILLVFSGVDRFRNYGLAILALSTLGWLFRAKLKKYTFLLIAESTVSLVLLIDIVRRIVEVWRVVN